MADMFPYLVLVVLVLAALGWMFYSDKIVRFFGGVQEGDTSWIFPSNPKKG